MQTLISAIKAHVSKAVHGLASQTSVDATAKRAEKAQTAADFALKVANAAGATADAALPRNDALQEGVSIYTWDGDSSGRDMVMVGSWTRYPYYKVSDDVILRNDFIRGFTTRSNGETSNSLTTGVENCFMVGDAFFVQKAGKFKVYPNSDYEDAPSAGIYFLQKGSDGSYPKQLNVTHDKYTFDICADDLTSLTTRVDALEGAGGGGAFVVTFTTEDGTTWTADKTNAEIIEAFKAGVFVRSMVVFAAAGFYAEAQFAQIVDNYVEFNFSVWSNDADVMVWVFIITSDNEVHMNTVQGSLS